MQEPQREFSIEEACDFAIKNNKKLESEMYIKNAPEGLREIESEYQYMRQQYSDAYFSGSVYNIGKSVTDFVCDSPISPKIFIMLLLLSAMVRYHKQ